MSVYLFNRDFFRRFPDDAACLDALTALRFGARPTCPKCGHAGRFARLSRHRAYACPRCGHHLHPMAGTAFDRSRVPLQSWFNAVYLTVHWRRRVPARTLARRLGISYPTALRMAREIGRRLAAIDAAAPAGRIAP